jgi:hypothetical protein
MVPANEHSHRNVRTRPEQGGGLLRYQLGTIFGAEELKLAGKDLLMPWPRAELIANDCFYCL